MSLKSDKFNYLGGFCWTTQSTTPAWVTLRACRICWRQCWPSWRVRQTPSGASQASCSAVCSCVLPPTATWSVTWWVTGLLTELGLWSLPNKCLKSFYRHKKHLSLFTSLSLLDQAESDLCTSYKCTKTPFILYSFIQKGTQRKYFKFLWGKYSSASYWINIIECVD